MTDRLQAGQGQLADIGVLDAGHRGRGGGEERQSLPAVVDPFRNIAPLGTGGHVVP